MIKIKRFVIQAVFINFKDAGVIFICRCVVIYTNVFCYVYISNNNKYMWIFPCISLVYSK